MDGVKKNKKQNREDRRISEPKIGQENAQKKKKRKENTQSENRVKID